MIDNTVPLEDYVLFADTRKSVSGLNKRMLFILLPLILLMFAMSHFAQGFSIPIHSKTPPYLVKHIRVAFGPVTSNLLTWFLLAECAFLYLVVARSHQKQAKPIVILSLEGIQVDTMAAHLGLMRWNEIQEVRSYNFIYRYVGVVPKSPTDLSKRMTGVSFWMFRLNAACVPLYKPFGVFVAPINIPQIYLPITVDELLAHIQTYQRAYQEKANQFHPGLGLPTADGDWPPPPRIGQ